MKKFRLLLLDANVVIELFRQGLWNKLLESCDVYLSRTVAEVEAHFYRDSQGDRQDFDLQPCIQAGKVVIFDILPSDLATFRAQFDATYLERLDAGEAESLAYLINSATPCMICSADKIVYRVLGNTNRDEQGISLEEVLQQIGLGRSLSWPFAKAFRKTWTKKGFQEGLGDIGREL